MGKKTLLVTGGSRGIGRATALAAAKAGWRVAVNFARSEPAARETVAEIESAGGTAIAVKGDVAVEAEVMAMFEAARRAWAARRGRGQRRASSRRPRGWSKCRASACGACSTSTYWDPISQRARRRGGCRRGLADPGGSIVVVSSAAARLGSPNLYVDYAGAKAALDTLVKGLSIELGDEGVRVNGVRPGLIATDIHASGGEPERAYTLGATAPMRRPGRPEEVASAICWLLDDEAASYVTGAILDVSGGR